MALAVPLLGKPPDQSKAHYWLGFLIVGLPAHQRRVGHYAPQ